MTTHSVPHMSVAQIRQTFLDFFAARGHTIVPSSPLVPANDPTLMFTNSGMVQFKDVFLGADKRPYNRATSVQACLRAGGKHNDLENVGYTARHHTFFEMLGNWSFGDYFKKESLQWGWELLTQVYKLPPERLLATVYHEDDEAYDIWTKVIGLPPERVIRIGDNKGGKYKSDNFWMMADTGPCGPCSEIFYDHGPHIPGGPPGSPDEDGDRFIEIWNHVFMQFEMHEDGSVTRLPAPCVDTGMGLERVAAILQGVHSNYEIDLFQALIRAAAREVGVPFSMDVPSLKVIADHIRACSFLIADGVIPGNEGRGYVLRRIIRRAIRHGYKLGQKQPFFYKLVPDLNEQMGQAYPHLRENAQRIAEVLEAEEKRFFLTIGKGMAYLDSLTFEDVAANVLCSVYGKEVKLKLNEGVNTKIFGRPDPLLWKGFDGLVLDNNKVPVGGISFENILNTASEWSIDSGKFVKFMANLDSSDYKIGIFCVLTENDQENKLSEYKTKKGKEIQIYFFSLKYISWFAAQNKHTLSGFSAFYLHDTEGFPLDLTQDICRERGMTVDVAGFDAAMQQQKNAARAAGKFKMDKLLEYDGEAGVFTGYEEMTHDACRVVALYADGASANELKAGQAGVVVLDTTPFYAESGGQVGDAGLLTAPGVVFEVADTQKIKAGVHGHHGVLTQGALKVGDAVQAQVDTQRRQATMRNHSVTHLMHKALREVLGSHVQQKGSLVDAAKTRFDFTHGAPVTPEEIAEIERRVNAEILANTATQARVMDIDSARETGAMMLFGEKYGDTVRVLDIGASRELCGGTHVARTGDIGLFKIVMESGVAAGIRRVEAITGLNALNWAQATENAVQSAAAALHAPAADLQGRLRQTLDHIKTLEKEVAQLKGRLASAQGGELASQAVSVHGVQVLAARLDGADAQTLRETMDKLKDKLKTAAIVLAATSEGKVQLAAGVTPDTVGRIKAGELVNFVAQQVGGKGGGKPDMAMAGGTNAAALPQALQSVQGWVAAKLA